MQQLRELFKSSVLIIVCLLSCQNKDTVVYDVPIPVMQESENSFCVVLHDSLYNPQNYIDKVKAFAEKDFVLDFINTDRSVNRWYLKLLRPHILPITCVFKKNGDLLDIIPGDSKEAILYTESTLINEQMNFDYHYNQKYGEEKKVIVSLYDALIKYRLQIEKYEENRRHEIEEPIITDSLVYPYSLVLKMKHKMLVGDTLSAESVAREIEESISSENIYTYYDDLFEARHVLDSSYNESSAPKIVLDSLSFSLGQCHKDAMITRVLRIENKGKNVLNILKILTSCSCVELLQDIEGYKVYPDEELLVGIRFVPDRMGVLEREIYILSDSYEQPLLVVPIKCNVI